MKITVVSKWFEERELAPFFINHYSYADEIVIYLDKNSNDGTFEFIENNPKVKIVWGDSGGKLNDYDCVEAINKIAYNCKSDWLIYADADEFLFPANFEDPREVLANVDGNLVFAYIWDMYKHESELPLDYSNPSILQRRHGDPNSLIYEHKKPTIIKPEIKIHWGIGCHEYNANSQIVPASIHFQGAHWQSADLDIACKRRIKNVKERLSDLNLQNNWAFHNFNITREELERIFEEHKNDPQLF